MKKLIPIFVFIFMTGLFTGLFFSMNLAEENNSYLFSLLICSFSDPSAGFFKMLVSALISNLIPAAAALSAILSRYKSFFYRFFNCKLISYIGTFGIVLICLFLSGYKHCFPFSVIQNSCDKGCLRPFCFFSVGGCFYTDKIFLLGFQFHILRKDLCRCITVYSAAFIDLFLKSKSYNFE